MFGHVLVRVPGADKCFISPGASTDKTVVRPEHMFFYNIDGTIIEHPAWAGIQPAIVQLDQASDGPVGCQLTSVTAPSAAGVKTASTARPAASLSGGQLTRLPIMRTPFASSSSTSTTA